MKHKLEILFEDDDFVIINKDAGLLSTPDRYRSNLPSLKSILRKIYGDIFVLHRLDMDTSGVICFGKNPIIQQQFTEMQINNEVDKYYLALIEGIPTTPNFKIEKPLKYDQGKTLIAKQEKLGKPATTIVELQEELGQYALVRCKLITGRTHQIRVHLRSAGHPLAVDKLYGFQDAIYLSEFKRKFKTKAEQKERPLIYRQTLHANTIAFEHPTTKQPIEIEAPLKKDFKAVLNQLRKVVK